MSCWANQRASWGMRSAQTSVWRGPIWLTISERQRFWARMAAISSGCAVSSKVTCRTEWERAARTEAGWRTPWGNGRAIWSRSRELHQIDPVMSFRTDVSPYGVFDLAGNAREWVSDWYSDTAFADAAKRPLDLPNWPGQRKPSIDNHRVVKGNGPDWSVWHRAAQHMSHEAADIGFRCVLRLDAGEEEQDEKKKSTRRN